jgi:tripartite-type tricarboxylate transporter receptor subunit TctC
MSKKNVTFFFVASSLLFLVSVSTAAALDYPRKAVNVINAYAAGGRTDMIGRLFVQVFSKYLKQPAVILNKPGAGTVTGTMEVVNAEPDGHTLGLFSNGLVAAHYTLPDTIQLWKELEPISMFNFDSTVIVVSEKTGFKNLQDLITFVKKNPKKLRVGVTPGSGTALSITYFMTTLGLDVLYIPFKGGGDIVPALAGGHIDFYFDAPLVYKSQVDAQKARFLGILASRRSEFFPDIPTLKEQGVDMVVGAFHGLFAPRKTSPEIIQFLETSIERTTKDKEFIDIMKKNQVSIEYKNRQEFMNYLEKEDGVYKKVAKEIIVK